MPGCQGASSGGRGGGGTVGDRIRGLGVSGRGRGGPGGPIPSLGGGGGVATRNTGPCFLPRDVRTLTFCQRMGFPSNCYKLQTFSRGAEFAAEGRRFKGNLSLLEIALLCLGELRKRKGGKRQNPF